MFQYIYDPLQKKDIQTNSLEGKQLLKSYIKTVSNFEKTGGMIDKYTIREDPCEQSIELQKYPTFDNKTLCEIPESIRNQVVNYYTDFPCNDSDYGPQFVNNYCENREIPLQPRLTQQQKNIIADYLPQPKKQSGSIQDIQDIIKKNVPSKISKILGLKPTTQQQSEIDTKQYQQVKRILKGQKTLSNKEIGEIITKLIEIYRNIIKKSEIIENNSKLIRLFSIDEFRKFLLSDKAIKEIYKLISEKIVADSKKYTKYIDSTLKEAAEKSGKTKKEIAEISNKSDQYSFRDEFVIANKIVNKFKELYTDKFQGSIEKGLYAYVFCYLEKKFYSQNEIINEICKKLNKDLLSLIEIYYEYNKKKINFDTELIDYMREQYKIMFSFLRSRFGKNLDLVFIPSERIE